MVRKAAKLSRQQRYEARGTRPGTPVGTRLDDTELGALDRARGRGTKNEISRSEWLKRLIRRGLGLAE
jgi:hypothetical protein